MLNNIPDITQTFFRGNSYKLILRDDLVSLEQRVTRIGFPDVSIDSIKAFHMGKQLNIPGDSLKYSPITIFVKLSSDLKEFVTMFNYLNKIKTEYSKNTYTTEAKIIINDNQNNKILEIELVDFILGGIGEFELKTEDDAVSEMPINCTVTELKIKS